MEIKTEIPEENIEDLTKVLNKLSRRASRLNLEPIEYSFSDPFEKSINIDEIEVTRFHVQVNISGEVPKLPDWEYMGYLEPDEDAEKNIIHAWSDEDVPKRFRGAVGICDHCQKKRRRNKTILVKHNESGDWKAVGTSCAQDYTGSKELVDIVKYHELLKELREGSRSGEWTGWKEPRRIPLKMLIEMAYAYIGKYGYVKTSEQKSTSFRIFVAYCNLINPSARKEDIEHKRKVSKFLSNNKPDEAFIQNFLDYVADWQGKSDYEHNVQTICAQSGVTFKQVGFLASAVHLYMKSLRKAQKPSEAIDGPDLPIGKRLDFELFVTRKFTKEGPYGSYNIVNFQDGESRRITYFGKKNFTEGISYTLSAKVKRTDNYKGKKSFIIHYPTQIKKLQG